MSSTAKAPLSGSTMASFSNVQQAAEHNPLRSIVDTFIKPTVSSHDEGNPHGKEPSNRELHPDDKPSHTIEALMAPRGLPKRRSLSGIFGLAMKKSLHKLRGHHTIDAEARMAKSSTSKLSVLPEDLDELPRPKPLRLSTSPYRSRFGDTTAQHGPAVGAEPPARPRDCE